MMYFSKAYNRSFETLGDVIDFECRRHGGNCWDCPLDNFFGGMALCSDLGKERYPEEIIAAEKLTWEASENDE